MEIILDHDVDIHVCLHISALWARRRDLPLLFDKVVICQIDCWRIQPNTELPGNYNEPVPFLDSAPALSPTIHYCTVQYPSPVAGTTPVRTGLHMDHHIQQTTQHSRNVSDYPSLFALSSTFATSTARTRGSTLEPCTV